MVKISVIVPTYNRGSVISRAIDSVLNQTFEDFELILIDDGSTDDTQSIVRSYEDERISYIYQPHSNANVARNRGIEMANGTYISFLDSDDAFCERNLEKTYDVLMKQPDRCAGIYTSYKIIDDDDEELKLKGDERITYPDFEYDHRKYLGGLSTTMFHKNVLYDVGLFDEKLNKVQDIDLYLRIFKKGYEMVGVDEILLKRYENVENRMGKNNSNKIDGYTYFLEKYDDELPVSVKAEYLMKLAKSYLAEEMFDEVIDVCEEYYELGVRAYQGEMRTMHCIVLARKGNTKLLLKKFASSMLKYPFSLKYSSLIQANL